ncbi:MAG TPA: OmpA family protein [Actinomycetales bacterium]|jgi:outer membrane protein OmpA-like peptidoglycan-associated protein
MIPRARTAGRARACTAAVSGAVVAAGALLAPPSASAQAVDEVPSVASFTYAVPYGGPASYVGAVNAVRRVEGGTILYWSLGGVDGADLFNAVQKISDFSDQTTNGGLYTVRLVDTRSGKVYRPLLQGRTCLCTSDDDLLGDQPPDTLYAMYAAFPELDPATTSVDIDVSGFGDMVTGVPVEEGGPLTPTVAASAVPLGQGWPMTPDAAAMRAAMTETEQPPVYDLVVSTGSTDNATRTKTLGRRVEVDLAADVFFAFDKADLNAAATATLRTAAGQIKESGATSAAVVGYTDSKGETGYNLALSKARAAAVVAALRPLLPGVALSASGKGEAEPIADNKIPQGQALNRRVTITFQATS